MTVHPLRRRLLELDDPDLAVEDDGSTFTFTYTPSGVDPSVLRWSVDDETLSRLSAGGAAEAREAWGTAGADGLYFVISWIQDAAHLFEGSTGRLELGRHGLRAVPD
jgi:hypothetical protein